MTTYPAATDATAATFEKFARTLLKALPRAEAAARTARERRDLVLRGIGAGRSMGRELGEGEVQMAAEVTEEAQKRAAQFDDVRARIECLAAGWNPFLPLGTVVRLARYPEHSPAGDIECLPKLGSVGVVAGPNFDSYHPLRVGFWSAFSTNHGAEWDPCDPELHPDSGEPFVYCMDADCLEILAPGRYLDGSPCEAVCFVATHHGADDPEEAVMVVEADGAHWHFTVGADKLNVHCMVDPRKAPEGLVELGRAAPLAP